ncbi:GNAT family N-acetyltransferase [bacterium]|nr:GNAT family N-acetyltransferase [bacterium]
MAARPTARLLTPSDRPALDALWESTANRYLVQCPAFAEHATLPGEARFIGIIQSKKLVMAIPFSRSFSRLWRLDGRHAQYWYSPLFAPFAGPMIAADHPDSESFWRDCLGVVPMAIPKVAEIVNIVFPPGVQDARGLAWKRWTNTLHYNYVTCWDEPGSWEAQPESSVRRQARKAREAGLAGDVLPAGQTAELEELWRRNSKRQGLPPQLADNLSNLGPWLESTDSGFLIVIRDGTGKPHAAGLFGYDKHRVYYFAGASEPEELGSGGSTLLHFEALAEIDRRGLPHCYDWVGANTPSIAQFKKKFRPRLETYVSSMYATNRIYLINVIRGMLGLRDQS